MIKILLIGEKIKNRSFNGANKALPVLASSLHNAGFDDVIQLDFERSDLTKDEVLKECQDADLIAFAGCLTPQWPEIDEHLADISNHVRSLNKNPPIIVGGYASKSVEDIAKATPQVAAFFDGEGEEAIVSIARSVARGAFRDEMQSIKGLCFVKEQGGYHQSIAARVANIDIYDQHYNFVHVPSVHNMDIFTAQGGEQAKTAQVFSQRGCPWNCGFCNKSMEGANVTRLSEKSFRDQLRSLSKKGFEAVYLDVDTFTVSERAALREAQILKEEGFIWGSNTRIDKINISLIKQLVQNNCVYMFFGVEHILPEVLLAIEKYNGTFQVQLEKAKEYRSLVRRVFKDMDEVGLPSSYFIILGLPKAKLNETQTEIIGYEPTRFEDDMEAISFGLLECDPDFINLNILRFMPGSTAADIASHPAYSCIRPSGEKPVTGGYFLPRVAKKYGYTVTENHTVYRLCESVGLNQPTTTAIDPQRAYDTVKATMALINKGILREKKATKMFIDRELLTVGLVKRNEQGLYWIAPFKEFEMLA